MAAARGIAVDSVRELVQTAFDYVGVPLQSYVEIDPKLFRPAEVDILVGDASKTQAKLGWMPEVSFHEMIAMMVEADLKRLSHLAQSGRL